MSGKLIIFSAPSGAGKTTIVKKLLQENFNLEFSISACSRDGRHNEKHGKDYYFISVEEFKNRIEKDEFIEWEEVYPNQYYGTLRTEINRIWSNGNNVIFDVDVIGGLNIKKQYPDKSLAVFVKPPSIAELEKRLINRSSDSKEHIIKRVAKAESEMSYANQFDVVIINESIDKAVRDTIEVISKFLK